MNTTIDKYGYREISQIFGYEISISPTNEVKLLADGVHIFNDTGFSKTAGCNIADFIKSKYDCIEDLKEDIQNYKCIKDLFDMTFTPPDAPPPRGGIRYDISTGQHGKHGLRIDDLTGQLMTTSEHGTAEWFVQDAILLTLNGFTDSEIEKQQSRLRADIRKEQEQEERYKREEDQDMGVVTELKPKSNINDAPLETPGVKYWGQIKNAFNQNIRKIDIREYELNEVDSAKLFVDVLGDWFRFNTTNNGFNIWTGTHWTPDLWKLAERSAAIVGEVVQGQLSNMNPGLLKDAAGFVRHIRSSSGIRAMLFFVSSDSRIVTSQEDYDSEFTDHFLNTPSGTVNLKTGEIKKHRPSDLITKITKVSPDKNHTPKMFTTFLNNITLGREDLKEALQRFLGSCCSGHSPKERCAIFYGEGSNGKTVILEATADLLHDYAKSLDIRFLTEGQQQSGGHSDELAILAGCRMCISTESNKSTKLDEAKIKKLTGGDTIAVSKKHGRTFEMRGCFTLTILTNYKPKISGQDKAIWRRVYLFPFDYTVPESEKDVKYKNTLLSVDAPFILQWLIDGCVKWYDEGYGKFETVEDATNDYKKDQDILLKFIDECCKVDKGFSVSAGLLKTTFDKWMAENDSTPLSNNTWRESLESKGFTRSRGMSGATWKGLTLLTPDKSQDNY